VVALTFQPSTGQFHLFSAFLQDQIALVPEKLKLTLGSKFEHNDFTGFEMQPTVRLLWASTPQQSVWAAASRAVRTPNLSEGQWPRHSLTSGARPLSRTAPNRDFQAEELMAYELGYRVQAAAELAADLALFYHDYDNLRVSVPGGTFTDPSGAVIRPLLVENAMKGKTYGAELGVQWAGNRVRGAARALHTARDESAPAGRPRSLRRKRLKGKAAASSSICDPPGICPAPSSST